MQQANQQVTMYEKRQPDFARVRALIRKILKGSPNLTREEISKEFLLRYGFLPCIGNRLREDRKAGFVKSRIVNGKKLWYLAEVTEA